MGFILSKEDLVEYKSKDIYINKASDPNISLEDAKHLFEIHFLEAIRALFANPSWDLLLLCDPDFFKRFTNPREASWVLDYCDVSEATLLAMAYGFPRDSRSRAHVGWKWQKRNGILWTSTVKKKRWPRSAKTVWEDEGNYLADLFLKGLRPASLFEQGEIR